MIDVWTVCWRAPKEKHSDGAMITLYQPKTKANVRLMLFLLVAALVY